jgi:hypothetical protein
MYSTFKADFVPGFMGITFVSPPDVVMAEAGPWAEGAVLLWTQGMTNTQIASPVNSATNDLVSIIQTFFAEAMDSLFRPPVSEPSAKPILSSS